MISTDEHEAHENESTGPQVAVPTHWGPERRRSLLPPLPHVLLLHNLRGQMRPDSPSYTYNASTSTSSTAGRKFSTDVLLVLAADFGGMATVSAVQPLPAPAITTEVCSSPEPCGLADARQSPISRQSPDSEANRKVIEQ